MSSRLGGTIAREASRSGNKPVAPAFWCSASSRPPISDDLEPLLDSAWQTAGGGAGAVGGSWGVDGAFADALAAGAGADPVAHMEGAGTAPRTASRRS
jgi:hypothetical protein